MGSVPDLVDTIEGYLNNTTTDRRVLVNQIKRATGQIRHKFNNLQTHLTNEQQARRNAEADRDTQVNAFVDLGQEKFVLQLLNR